jgi:hypothetical protein
MKLVNSDKDMEEMDDSDSIIETDDMTENNDRRSAEYSIKRSIKPATSAEVKHNKSMFDQMMSINERNKKYFYPNQLVANGKKNENVS